MLTGGYIRLHRKIVEWEWYHDAVVSRVFLHLLITANYEPGRFEGYEIGVGQCVISLQGVADALRISKDAVSRALKKLEKSGELQRKPTAKFTIIMLKNYPYYQQGATEADRLPTACRPQADPMEESKKARKQESKKGRGRKETAFPPLTPEQKKSLIDIYGEENVNHCIENILSWKKSQGRCLDVDFALLDRWMREDLKAGKIKLPQKAQSFTAEELERTTYEQYKKKA